jgi:hypothetical protein
MDFVSTPFRLRRQGHHPKLRFGFGTISNPKSKIENLMAEGVRFELTRPFGLPVFKTGAFNRSATPPTNSLQGTYSYLRFCDN